MLVIPEMKLFIDTANVREIETALRRGIVRGVTTNPTLLAKEPKGDYRKLVQGIVAALKEFPSPVPLSVEVFATRAEAIVRQALEFRDTFDHDPLYIKVPIGWEELEAIHELKRRDVAVNVTACMSVSQAVLAAQAGAGIVSLFCGRIRDAGQEPFRVVRETASLFQRMGELRPLLLAGSIRHVGDIETALSAGADIVTVPPVFLAEMATHPKTTEVVGQFLRDFENWLEK